MKVVNAEEMRSIDKKTIDVYGIPAVVLMERAGLAVAQKVREVFGKKKVIVLAGGGNNGGDGLAAARNLFNWGWNVKVLLVVKENKLGTDCLVQYRTAKKIGLPVEFSTNIGPKDLHSAVVIDAIFGTGINKPVLSPVSDLIRSINKSGVSVVSVDIPSGISSDNAMVLGDAVRADYTVTFGLPKLGHIMHPGAEYAGTLFVEDIGFPAVLLESGALKTKTVERADASMLVPGRLARSYKGDYGHVLIIAGSRGKTGATLMTARACLRSGAGMVTIGVPESLIDIYQSRVLEEMVLPLPDAGNGTLAFGALDVILRLISEKIDVIAIGPGIGVSADIEKLMTSLVRMSAAPMVIDADGINSLAGNVQVLTKARSPLVLTPHAGEMAGLLGGTEVVGIQRLASGRQKKGAGKAEEKNIVSATEIMRLIQNDSINTAMAFAKNSGTYLVLKGAPTVVAEPEGRAFINTTGNAGMATAGAGDVLTGMIAAFLGQGLNPLEASVLGVYMHGLAGDIASSDKGMHSLIASDIIDRIPSAFIALKKG